MNLSELTVVGGTKIQINPHRIDAIISNGKSGTTIVFVEPDVFRSRHSHNKIDVLESYDDVMRYIYTKERSDVSLVDNSSVQPSLCKVIRDKIGQKVAIVCPRFVYWGILSKVYIDGFELDKAVLVEDTGRSTNGQPQCIDPINSTIFIPIVNVELVFQPTWSQGPLPSEN